MSNVNEVNVAKWVVALRSGKYKQGRGCLRSGDEFCCLGVLCDVSQLGEWRDDGGYDVNGYRNLYMPAFSVGNWFGDSTDPLLDKYTSCSVANDKLGWTFREIGDMLESRYLTRKAEEILGVA